MHFILYRHITSIKWGVKGALGIDSLINILYDALLTG